ncbi:GNAT family protein [Nemorincola caseinilytica]|uniref:GNAT family protein n=1 Tax=Nemorincola caseinilytica TaxID=2054315 RepID=A0ABP8NJE4_9BACT
MTSITVDDNLLLRSYTPDDAGALFAAIDSQRQHLSPWLGWVAATTKPEHSTEFIQRSQMQMRDQEALPLGIFYNGAIIGGTGMYNWQHDIKRAQVGYWIGREHEGRGIVTRSLAALLDHLFTRAGLNKVEIHYIPTNKRSGRVAERLGFRIEGIIRKGVMNNGAPEDLVVTGLLKHEWRNPFSQG